jgi:glycosyltransferase involved in cell wall biosynthesis
VHHLNPLPFRRRSGFLGATASYVLQRASLSALRQADAISVLNRTVHEELVQVGFKPERLHVVGAGIDLERFSLPLKPTGSRRIIWINRLEPTKGIFDLPRICQNLPDGLVVDVIGRGPEHYVDRLLAELAAAGVADRCVIHGFVSESDLYTCLSKAAAFISCSYEEGWGISIAEALAMGVPCVAYDLPSHREIFGAALNLVPLGDARALALAVGKLLSHEDSEADRRARHSAAQVYSLDECAVRLERVFASLLV